MTTYQVAALLAAIGLGPPSAGLGNSPQCARCGWSPPQTRSIVTVGTVEELERALVQVPPGTTILLRDGVYRIRKMLDIATPDVVLRGLSGDPGRAILRGDAIDEPAIGVALSVSAPRVTLADLTVGLVHWHGVQIRGEKGADGAVLHNFRVIDTGEQLIKGSMGKDGRGPHDGLISCSWIGYTDHAPGDYTNGIDVLGGRGWVVRGNIVRCIRGPEGRRTTGPAILFWGGSSDTIIEGNLVLDCFRGIALGIGPQVGNERGDHRGGVIRRNAVCNLEPWADEGIEVSDCPGARVVHNTVMVAGQAPWSIGVRFPRTTAEVRNNLTNRQVIARDGAALEAGSNVTVARSDWFVDAARGDLRLAREGLPAVDAAVESPDSPETVAGRGPDAGAYEYRGGQ